MKLSLCAPTPTPHPSKKRKKKKKKRRKKGGKKKRKKLRSKKKKKKKNHLEVRADWCYKTEHDIPFTDLQINIPFTDLQISTSELSPVWACHHLLIMSVLVHRRRRRTAGTGSETIKATFQVGAESATDMPSLKDALTSGFDDQCSGDLCRFRADTTDPNSGLYGVSRNLSGFEGH